MEDLKAKVAVVTGAGQGIGAAVARVLSEAGAHIAVTDAVGARADDVASNLERARAWRLDVARSEDIEHVAREINDEMGVPAILVNNAGINRVGPSVELALADWQAVVDVNLTGVFRCCQVFARPMLSAGEGTIINIASINALVGMPGRAAYGATKAGVVGLTQVLASEWASAGIRVNAVAPGYVWTPLIASAIDAGLYGDADILDKVPARRFADPEDIAEAVLFLASERASFIVGETLVVDGGYTAYGAPTPTSDVDMKRFAPKKPI